MKDIDLKMLLKRVVELVMPDFRAYYRVVRKARVVKSYASNGQYWADIQPLRNDDSPDPAEPVVPNVEIPILWAGPDRGVICPPMAGVYCDLEYYDGDPDYPRISNFRWHGAKAPAIDVGGFIIQHSAGTFFKIDPDKNIIQVTPGDIENTPDKDWTVAAGGNVKISAGGTATIQAPLIALDGPVTSSGGSGSGKMTLNCDLDVNGSVHATGTIIDDSGNTNHHGHP